MGFYTGPIPMSTDGLEKIMDDRDQLEIMGDNSKTCLRWDLWTRPARPYEYPCVELSWSGQPTSS